MKNAFSVAAAAVVVLSMFDCGGGAKCPASCPSGQTCTPSVGVCLPNGGTGGGASGGGGGSTGVGGGTNPVCATCGGDTPRCLIFNGAASCVECLNGNDCATGSCNVGTHRCYDPNASGGGSATGGGSAAGGGTATGGGSSAGGGTAVGGGSATGGGSTMPDGGMGGGTATGGGSNGSVTWVVFDGGTPLTHTGACAPQDAGVTSCSPNCRDGFTCVGGMCILNGGSGPVQVTLRWNSQEDLDLHVDEPLPNGGVCEIYYGDTGGPASTCGAVGELDLDSEAGCPSPPDFVDIENVIYPPNTSPPTGTYTVRIDHYSNCNTSLSMVPFEVEARFGGKSVGLCGVFLPTDPDWDAAGSSGGGRTVLQFTIP